MKKKRIDVLMMEKGITESRNKAQRLVMAGEVSVNGQMVHKPSDHFPEDCLISIKNRPKYVSRGGLKLEKGFNTFGIGSLKNKVCADVGSSTGGFTDLLIQNGALKVYAIDVGYGQLHQSLRDDPRVIEMERHNIKDVCQLPEEIDLLTIDVSFISLKRVLPVFPVWNKKKIMNIIALIKPQFEVGRKIAAKGKGVVKKEEHRLMVVNDIRNFASEQGYRALK